MSLVEQLLRQALEFCQDTAENPPPVVLGNYQLRALTEGEQRQLGPGAVAIIERRRLVE